MFIKINAYYEYGQGLMNISVFEFKYSNLG